MQHSQRRSIARRHLDRALSVLDDDLIALLSDLSDEAARAVRLLSLFGDPARAQELVGRVDERRRDHAWGDIAQEWARVGDWERAETALTSRPETLCVGERWVHALTGLAQGGQTEMAVRMFEANPERQRYNLTVAEFMDSMPDPTLAVRVALAASPGYAQVGAWLRLSERADTDRTQCLREALSSAANFDFQPSRPTLFADIIKTAGKLGEGTWVDKAAGAGTRALEEMVTSGTEDGITIVHDWGVFVEACGEAGTAVPDARHLIALFDACHPDWPDCSIALDRLRKGYSAVGRAECFTPILDRLDASTREWLETELVSDRAGTLKQDGLEEWMSGIDPARTFHASLRFARAVGAVGRTADAETWLDHCWRAADTTSDPVNRRHRLGIALRGTLHTLPIGSNFRRSKAEQACAIFREEVEAGRGIAAGAEVALEVADAGYPDLGNKLCEFIFAVVDTMEDTPCLRCGADLAVARVLYGLQY